MLHGRLRGDEECMVLLAGIGKKEIAMMTGAFSRPHSIRDGAITQLGPARNRVPVHIDITMWRGVR